MIVYIADYTIHSQLQAGGRAGRANMRVRAFLLVQTTDIRTKANTRKKSRRILFDCMNDCAFILFQRTPRTRQLTHHLKSRKKNGKSFIMKSVRVLHSFESVIQTLGSMRAFNFLQVYCINRPTNGAFFWLTHIACSKKKNKIAELKKNHEWCWCTNKSHNDISCLLIPSAVDRIHHACAHTEQTLYHITARFVRVCQRVCVPYFSICELLAQRIDHMLKSIALRLNIHIITSGELCV